MLQHEASFTNAQTDIETHVFRWQAHVKSMRRLLVVLCYNEATQVVTDQAPHMCCSTRAIHMPNKKC